MDDLTQFQERMWYVLQSVVLTGIAIAILVLASSYVLVIIAGILLAILALRLMQLFQRRFAMSHGLSFVVAWLLIIGVPLGLLVISFPNLQAQFSDVGEHMSLDYLEESWFGNLPGVENLMEHISTADVTDWVRQNAPTGQIGGYVFSTVNAVVSVFLLLFIGVYGSFDPYIYRRQLRQMIPRVWYKTAEQRYSVIAETLGRWMFGRLSSMVVVAVLTYIGLWLLGVHAAFLLAVLAGLFSFVPNIGPIASVVSALAVAATQDPTLLIWVILLYIGVQTVESYFITPFIQQWSVDIPPATLLIAQAILGVLFGILGIILAGPCMALVIALTSDEDKFQEAS